jgi:peroxiredoxin
MKAREPSEWALIGLVLGGLVLGFGLGWLIFRPDLGLAQTGPAPTSIASASGTPLFTTLPAPARSYSAPAPVAGAPAPDFTLKTLDGEMVTLSQFRGQPVLINFWATWCPPCRLEMPDLVKAYEAHQSEGFVLLGVNLTYQDSLPEVQAFVDEFGMTFPVLLDEDGHVTDDLYRLRGLPLSVFVNREGVIARLHIGALPASQIETYVGEILN